MPILDIEIVGSVANTDQLAQRLAKASGKALRSRPEGTWVKLRYLDPSCYAENESSVDVSPVFVNLLEATAPEGEELESQLRSLTLAIATVLERPSEHIHIVFEAPASGRISFGGTLRK